MSSSWCVGLKEYVPTCCLALLAASLVFVSAALAVDGTGELAEQAHLTSEADYWPIGLGAYWQFEGQYSVRHEVIRQMTVGVDTTFVMATWVMSAHPYQCNWPGRDPDSVLVLDRPSGLCWYGLHYPLWTTHCPPGWDISDVPQLVYKHPASVGETWTVETCPDYRPDMVFWVTSTDATVYNPTYGQFDSCYVYEFQDDFQCRHYIALAPDVGPVSYWDEEQQYDKHGG